MPLIKDGRLAEDTWVTLEDEARLPDDTDLIVSLERWQRDRDALSRRTGRLGLRLRSDQPAALIAGDLRHFTLIALEFPKFTDGRAYSTARVLRERHGYRGELRAVGDVLRDQFLFLQRCGFDAFEVANEAAPEAWEQAISEVSVYYQPTADGRPSATALRRQRSVAANWAY